MRRVDADRPGRRGDGDRARELSRPRPAAGHPRRTRRQHSRARPDRSPARFGRACGDDRARLSRLPDEAGERFGAARRHSRSGSALAEHGPAGSRKGRRARPRRAARGHAHAGAAGPAAPSRCERRALRGIPGVEPARPVPQRNAHRDQRRTRFEGCGESAARDLRLDRWALYLLGAGGHRLRHAADAQWRPGARPARRGLRSDARGARAGSAGQARVALRGGHRRVRGGPRSRRRRAHGSAARSARSSRRRRHALGVARLPRLRTAPGVRALGRRLDRIALGSDAHADRAARRRRRAEARAAGAAAGSP